MDLLDNILALREDYQNLPLLLCIAGKGDAMADSYQDLSWYSYVVGFTRICLHNEKTAKHEDHARMLFSAHKLLDKLIEGNFSPSMSPTDKNGVMVSGDMFDAVILHYENMNFHLTCDINFDNEPKDTEPYESKPSTKKTTLKSKWYSKYEKKKQKRTPI
mmetsp:Transcript_23397/g.25978  ORF Transcript_23397/g.25978 Transcript_23397/m.25978 type:complete len:160 (+) Transcript_23397:130-609(+)